MSLRCAELASRDAIIRGLDDATYRGIIGGAFYLVAGRKPGVPGSA